MSSSIHIIIVLCLLPMYVWAQTNEKHTINGAIQDKQTGEILIGASITLLQQPNVGSTSNNYGTYIIQLKEGVHTIVTSFAGYISDTQNIVLNKDTMVNIKLMASGSLLKEVVVAQKGKKDIINQSIMGVQTLSVNEIKYIPVLLGEKDILKTIQLLPGIKSAGDGNSGFYVRGGGADQNLILLDEATVYNASHLLGFFSTFNSDAIKDVTIYKGGMPADYGGRLSSVLDVKTRDGNNQKFNMNGGIGLIASRLNIEVPIVKDKSSFIISGRRTYADVFLKLFGNSTVRQNTLYFYDFNAKANYQLNNKNRLYMSLYTGRDKFGFGNAFGADYGNATANLRWNHVINHKFFSNTSLIYNYYSYQVKVVTGKNDISITSKIRDINLKEDLQYYHNASNKIHFGVNLIYHNIIPGALTASEISSFNSVEVQKKISLESSAYISHEWNATKNINLTYGLRLSTFSVLGPGTFHTYDSAENIVTSSIYPTLALVKLYVNVEPRLALNYNLTSNSAIKASYMRNVQNLHLLSNSMATNPTDVWISSSNNVKPEIADQVAVGYYQNLLNNAYEFSSEIYYKSLQRQIGYKNGAELRVNENVESQLLFGKGRAYGIELFFKKKYGKLNGWLGYTLSKAERKFDGINNGNYFNAMQDRTHELSVVSVYEASKRWIFAAMFVYYTGNAVTFPSGKYSINNQTIFYYTETNGYRMPDYHRLDVSVTLRGKKLKKFESYWTFSIYNVYNRANAYAINFQDDPNDPSKAQAVQTTLFKMIPSVTYNFKF